MGAASAGSFAGAVLFLVGPLVAWHGVVVVAEDLPPWDVELVMSSYVLGAAYPVDERASECSSDQLRSRPCQCFGGAARRAAMIQDVIAGNASESGGERAAVPIDLGGYFFGSGSFYQTFNGSASARLFGSAGYKTRGLTFRDFAAGVSEDDPTGGRALRDNIRQSQKFTEAMGGVALPAVATNLDLSGDPYLNDEDLVKTYAVVTFDIEDNGALQWQSGGRKKMGVLSLIDSRDLAEVSPYYANRTIPYERAITTALITMYRNLEIPHSVVLLVQGVPFSDMRELLTDFNDDLLQGIAEEGLPEGLSFETIAASRELLAVHAIAEKFYEIDLILLTNGDANVASLFAAEHPDGIAEIKNWAGDTVAVSLVGGESGRGIESTRVRVTFDDIGFYQAGSIRREVVTLDCNVSEDAQIREELDAYKVEIEDRADHFEYGHAGYVARTIDSRFYTDGNCTTPPGGMSLCGCSVAECAAGNLVADAYMWYSGADVALVVAGALTDSSLTPFQVRQSHLLEMLPDTGDEVVIVRGVSGADLRQLLEASVTTIEINETMGGHGRCIFLQVSHSLKFYWFYESITPTLADDFFINGTLVKDDDEFTVAVSSRLLPARYGTGIASGVNTRENDMYANLLVSQEKQNSYLTTWIKMLGVSAHQVVAAYLSANYPDPTNALDPLEAYDEPRIEQTADVAQMHIAVLCGSTIARREQCDHARHAIDLINNHRDGFYDELIPHSRLIVYERTVGCAMGGAFDGLVDIAQYLQQLETPARLTAVVLTCSDDVADVASAEARQSFSELFPYQGSDYVVISPSSTAPELADETAYPLLARLATPESDIARANEQLLSRFHWNRVAVVYEDSLWGYSSAQAFIDSAFGFGETDYDDDHKDHDDDHEHSRRLDHDDDYYSSSGRVVLGDACLASCAQQATRASGESAGVSFSLDAFDAGEITGLDILQALDGTDAKIIFLATYPRVQRSIFAASRTNDLYSGTGFGWITNLPSESSFFTTDGMLDYEAVYGSEGVLGLVEHVPDYEGGNATSSYLDRWINVATLEACQDRELSVNDASVRTTYCDIDDNGRTFTGYSAFWVDSVIALAKGLDAIAINGNAGQPSASPEGAAMLYDTIVHLEPFNGVSGDVAMNEETGDRLGVLDLVNMQIQIPSPDEPSRGRALRSSSRAAASQEQRRLQVPLASTFADFVSVGVYVTFDSAAGLRVFSDSTIIFPGATTDIPSDESEEARSDTNRRVSRSRRRATIALIAACICFAGVLVCAFLGARWAFGHLKSSHRRALVASLNAYDVIESFDPFADEERKVQVLLKSGAEDSTSGEFVVSRVRDLPESSVVCRRSNLDFDEEVKTEQGPAVELTPYALELWYWEDDEPDSGNWVIYDELVQDLLSETYNRYMQLPGHVRETLARIGDDEDEDDETDALVGTEENLSSGRVSSVGTDIDPKCYKLLFYMAGSSTSMAPPPPPRGTGASTSRKRLEIDVAKMRQTNLDTGTVRSVKMESGSRRVNMTWFWRENLRNMSKWRDDVQKAQGTLWVKYEPDVQRRLSELYLAHRKDAFSPAKLRLDSYNEATTSETEFKYEIDIGTMWQTKLETGFRRPVCVMIEAVDRPKNSTHGGIQVVRGYPTVRNMPADIQGRDCLKLIPGMVVSVVYEHDSGEWGFGREIGKNDVVGDVAGWFPMSCVRPARRLEMTDAVLDEFRFLLPPQTWTYNADSPIEHQPKVVPLGRDAAKERQLIANLFDADYYDVISVERIQNVSLWRPYATKRMTTLERQDGIPGNAKKLQKRLKEVEMFPVFHGTQPDSVPKIIEQGFNRDFCSSNNAHGRGVYFATESEHSCFHTYSKPDADGVQHVFVCRIIVGNYCRGMPDAVVPPALETNPNQRYDTTVDNEHNPTIYVTYNDHQAYPSYLVKFKARNDMH
ncbi:hypothetical protein CTAYLR_006066 [Chrysophaeum taylorii]|uniref:Poly [ADP-ribose] polymerase n=1 Tax=Chrysophaeum taylorii TaxID=2483200 RepID=A0AAD7ULS9_9STRA|nr:hypothetical protein CTAYLR_006066 [Chrysophaeum taylorii]